MSTKIIITGSSGLYGKESVGFLLSKGYEPKNIFALVRDQNKGSQLFGDKGINIVIGDYNDKESLIKAFNGIDRMLFISSNDIEKNGQQHSNVIEAAKQVGTIKQIVYTSFYINSEIKDSTIDFVQKEHPISESLLKESGLVYTILQNGLYADFVIEYFLGANVLDKGIFYPAGDGIGNYVSRKDMAEAAVNILLEPDMSVHGNKVYVLSGVEGHTFQDFANILSESFSTTVNYTSPDIETFKDVLTGFGVPSNFIGLSVAFSLAIKNNEMKTTETDLPFLLGRQPKSFKQLLIDAYSKK